MERQSRIYNSIVRSLPSDTRTKQNAAEILINNRTDRTRTHFIYKLIHNEQHHQQLYKKKINYGKPICISYYFVKFM